MIGSKRRHPAITVTGTTRDAISRGCQTVALTVSRTVTPTVHAKRPAADRGLTCGTIGGPR